MPRTKKAASLSSDPPRVPKRHLTTHAGSDIDDGFINDNENDNDDDDRPSKAKKAKTAKTSGKDVEKRGKSGKEVTASVPGGGGVSDQGEEFWELSDKRRISISTYGGKRMMNIREYYEKDGQALPGKKGISLPMEQFSMIISLLPHIEAVLAAKGESVPRPEYDSGDGGGGEGEVVKGEEDSEEEDTKKNFEATSEDED